MKSLDPRVNRLPQIDNNELQISKAPLDQFGTFEVFVQPKEGKPFQHEGAVHAPTLEFAFMLAKETFTRRFTCSALCVAETQRIAVSVTTEGDANVYDVIYAEPNIDSTAMSSFEVYHLPKRGKQHIHLGQVMASSPEEAMARSKSLLPPNKIAYNLWTIKTSDLRYSTQEESDLWLTLPEKKFRDASDYKGGDKLKEFLERHK
jgi:ring-1,2-phenylacetyl-CoA epoxidase subunit PaaB